MIEQDREASKAGISPKAEVRQALIDWRTELMSDVKHPPIEHPQWDQILLLSHAIWWLTR